MLTHTIPAGPELLEPAEDAEVLPEDLTLSWNPVTETIDGIRTRKFRELVLDRQKTTFLPLDWTVVHTISEDSPLRGLTENDLRERDAEFLVLVNAIDDTSSQPVDARSSYKWQEVVWDAQFRDMYRITRDGRMSVDLRRLHDIEESQIRQQRQTMWEL